MVGKQTRANGSELRYLHTQHIHGLCESPHLPSRPARRQYSVQWDICTAIELVIEFATGSWHTLERNARKHEPSLKTSGTIVHLALYMYTHCAGRPAQDCAVQPKMSRLSRVAQVAPELQHTKGEIEVQHWRDREVNRALNNRYVHPLLCAPWHCSSSSRPASRARLLPAGGTRPFPAASSSCRDVLRLSARARGPPVCACGGV